MATPAFEIREFFHMAFLRQLGERLKGRPYALKGGMCLRLFHRSPRLSEDADYDVARQVASGTLSKAVDSVLTSRALTAQLSGQGVTGLQIHRSKQTETTQRWKISLEVGRSGLLPSRGTSSVLEVAGAGSPGAKIEFSRRRTRTTWTTGLPDPDLLAKYRMASFAVQHYDALSMAVQKIAALAASGRHATRDLFDLHHLLQVIRVDPKNIRRWIGKEEVKQALVKTAGFTHKTFRSEVLPFLTGNLIEYYGKSGAFTKLQEEVGETLRGILP